MRVLLTLAVQARIDAEGEDEFEVERDELVDRLEKMGLTVEVESEDEQDDDGFAEDDE